jgi:hypothetical protein
MHFFNKLSTLTFAVALMATPALAFDPAVTSVLDAAQNECRSFENGTLEVGENTVVEVDLTGDGKINYLVDASEMTCSTAASLFCGTGGCALTAVVDGKPHEFLAKGWRVIKMYDFPVLLLAVHGSECGGSGLRRCIKALTWSEGGFHIAKE